VHKEVSSDEFKRVGGSLEILQLWMNLPAKKKMVEPAYQGLQKDEIPVVPFDGGNIQVIAGNWSGVKGGARSITNHTISLIHFYGKAELTLNWEAGRSLFLYVVKGSVRVNGEKINSLQFPEFSEGGRAVTVTSEEPAILIYAEGTPINEPMVSHGPFVMNTEQEINQAIRDYQSGKMGVLR
jgi:redox-sensitive bicupin YhaK (pirin superfamily)